MENTKDNFCDVPTDGTCISFQEVLKLGDCKFPPGMCFTLQEIIVDKHGHEVDGDWKKDKNGEWVSTRECDHKDTPEYKAEHKKKPIVTKTKVEKVIQLDITTSTSTASEIIATVELPKADPVVPKKQDASMDTVITLIVGAISGIAGPMLMNIIKNLLKNKFKKSNKETKEEESEEPTDCKTHQIKNNAKIISITKRLGLIEQKLNTPKEEDDSNIDIDNDKISDLVDRIEKLEKFNKIKN